MNKLTYEEPTVEIVIFEAADVIYTSGGDAELPPYTEGE